MSAAALVAIIGGGVLLVAAFVTWLVTFILRRRRRAQVRIVADLSSEVALRGPESAISQPGTGSYPRAGGNGQLALSATRLIFRVYIGSDVVIALDQITGLREQSTYRRRRIGNRRFLIVVTDSGEAVYAVKNIAEWLQAIEQAAPHPLAVG